MKRLCRFLFSRYAVSLFFIILEISIFVPSLWLYEISEWVVVASGLVAIMSLISVVNKNANPEYKVTWIIVIIFLPYLGTVLYLLFSKRKISKREARIFSSIAQKMVNIKKSSESGSKMDKLASVSSSAATKARAIINDDYLAEVCTDSCVRYFPSGESMYEDMLESLKSAEKFIFLEYFIIEPGKMWSGIYDILKEKAALGVDVRVLYDDVGCMGTLPRGFDERLSHAEIKVARFGRITPMATVAHNNRDHRKLMIIDGSIAYTGGINIADEYINEKERFGHWKDAGVSVRGDALAPMLSLFLTAWDITNGTVSDYEGFLQSVTPQDGDGGYYIPYGSGPMPIYRRPVSKNVFLNIINQAEKYVYITTPYLVIDFDLSESLRNASLRGVDVRIITPGIPDKKIIKIMTKSSYRYLMDAGIKIYEYDGFIHEKTVISDDAFAVCGTVNFDYRSLAHHYENALFMYSAPAISDMLSEFEKTELKSARIDEKKAKLNLIEWIFKIFIRVFAPLL